MIKLIVGLGNPGQQYQKTRHNAGFLFLDKMAERYSCPWSKVAQFQGLIAECQKFREKLLLLKPQTYMNRSGQAVGQVLRYYKLTPEQILVIHDELDFAPGVVRLKMGGGHAGHNGLKDIIAHINGSNFSRLRIGIGRPPEQMAVADYVLSKPSKSEHDLMESSIDRGMQYIESIVNNGVDTVMNVLNRES